MKAHHFLRSPEEKQKIKTKISKSKKELWEKSIKPWEKSRSNEKSLVIQKKSKFYKFSFYQGYVPKCGVNDCHYRVRWYLKKRNIIVFAKVCKRHKVNELPKF